jgi:transposase
VDILKAELQSKIYLTTKAIVEFVCCRFNVNYSQRGMSALLKRLGYVYKKPKLVPGNPDTDAQEIFVEQYDSFMQEKPRSTEVLFLDAVHPEHNTMAAYGWMKKGETRELKTNSGRQRLNLHGAINAETYKMTVIESETIDSDSTINLLSTLENTYPKAKEIIVILDNAKYHYSKAVKEHLENSKIRLAFLPSYSPNLNLIERVWKFFKKNVLYNTYYENIKAFRKACIKFFSNFEKHYDEIDSIMSGEFEML